MTCDECRDQMLDVARQRSAPGVARAVHAHAAACAPCAAWLLRETEVAAGLRVLADTERAAVASPVVAARLMAAFAAQHQPPQTSRPVAGPATRWLPRAAAVVLCAGAAAWWLKPAAGARYHPARGAG